MTTEVQRTSMDYIGALIKGKNPIIWVLTHEETRFIRSLYFEVAEKLNREIWTWSGYHGLLKYGQEMLGKKAEGKLAHTANPIAALDIIINYESEDTKKTGSIWIMKDFNIFMNNPIPRQMKDIYYALIQKRATLIITSPYLNYGAGTPKSGIEPTLDKQISIVEFELPTRKLIAACVDEAIDGIHNKVKELEKMGKTIDIKSQYTDKEKEHFTSALQGLTQIEVESALTTCLCSLGELNEERLLTEKKQVIKRSDILEYIDVQYNMEDVGGLDLAKKYFQNYNNQFSDQAKEFGVEPLKGVILSGVCGCGKSLLAKCVSSLWKLPILRLDIGKVLGSLVGLSEERMRAAISQAEAIAPCVSGDTQVTILYKVDKEDKQFTQEVLTIEELYLRLKNVEYNELHLLSTRQIDTRPDGYINQNYSCIKIDDNKDKTYQYTALCFGVIKRPTSTKDIYEITTESGNTLVMTDNHKLLVYNNNTKTRVWKEAHTLTMHDSIIKIKEE